MCEHLRRMIKILFSMYPRRRVEGVVLPPSSLQYVLEASPKSRVFPPFNRPTINVRSEHKRAVSRDPDTEAIIIRDGCGEAYLRGRVRRVPER